VIFLVSKFSFKFHVYRYAEFKERELKRQKTSEDGASVAGATEEAEPVRPVVPFAACLERAAAPETVGLSLWGCQRWVTWTVLVVIIILCFDCKITW
jgi:hypothetical protein